MHKGFLQSGDSSRPLSPNATTDLMNDHSKPIKEIKMQATKALLFSKTAKPIAMPTGLHEVLKQKRAMIYAPVLLH